MAVDDRDLSYRRMAVDLAAQAVEAGDEPFGSVLVDADGEVLLGDHNHVVSGDETQHPEFAIARWAGQNLDAAGRAAATVYTSGEHCAMCSAAHGWVGLGRIVYASSGAQTASWYAEMGLGPARVRTLSVQEVAPGVPVDGPVDDLAQEVRALHRRFHGADG